MPWCCDAESLYQELAACEKGLDSAAPFYVLLDEVQDVEGWERIVRKLHTRASTDVYLTGSNANMLSSDLATQLTGRFVEINVYPPSFAEYLDFTKSYGPLLDNSAASDAMTNDALLADYLAYGSLPGLFQLSRRNLPVIGAEIQDIYRSILFKDVAQRFGIRDLATLEKVGRFVLTTAGSLLSLRSMSNTLANSGLKAAATTVASQVDALAKAFVVYPVEQTGIQGREILRPQKKYYPVDLGFMACMQNFSGANLGARLESAVALELMRRGCRVHVGTSTSSEVDFVAERLGGRGPSKEYIQVCADMGSEATRHRELAPLEALTDAFPRKIITLDRYARETTPEGIEIIHAVDWLLETA